MGHVNGSPRNKPATTTPDSEYVGAGCHAGIERARLRPGQGRGLLGFFTSATLPDSGGEPAVLGLAPLLGSIYDESDAASAPTGHTWRATHRRNSS
jgi:hypothetical protein